MRGILGLAAVGIVIVAGFSAGSTVPGPERFVAGFHAELPVAVGDTLHGATVVDVNEVLKFAVVVAPLPDDFVGRATADARVRYVEPDPFMQLIEVEPEVEPLYTPNDPSFSSQYGPQQIRAPLAWDTTRGSTSAAVCIVDTGLRTSHEEFSGRYLGGYNYVASTSTMSDDNGHGTHVAGSAAAAIANGKGIAGIGNVGIYAVKVLDNQGSGTWSRIANGIVWCADNTMSRTVISMSLGGGSYAQSVQDAVSHAYNTRGKLVVAAAGNDGPCSNCVGYPAKLSQVMAVTCTTSSDGLCSFSSTGPEAEIAAPGYNIYSTYHTSNSAYTTMSGTSMSTPHVSGAAALVWSHHTSLSASQMRQRLRDYSRDLGSAGWDASFGYGLLDAKCLLDASTSCRATPPSAPRNLDATPGYAVGTIALDWDAPSSTGGATITRYDLYRTDRLAGGAPVWFDWVSGSTTYYTDFGRTPGITYTYEVRAKNSVGQGPASGSSCSKPYPSLDGLC